MKNSIVKKIIVCIIILMASILIVTKSFAVQAQTEKVLGYETYKGTDWVKLEGDSKSVKVGEETKYNPGLETETGIIKYFTVTSGSSCVKVQKVTTNVTQYLLIKGLKAGTATVNVYYCPAGTTNHYKGVNMYSLKTLTITVKETETKTETKTETETETKKDTTGSTSTDNTEYTITYYVDNKVYNTQKYKLGTKVTLLDAPTKEGYQFVEWNTKADGTGNARSAGYNLSITYTKNITYYAIFKSKVEKIDTSKISILSKTGTTTAYTPIYSESGELIANMESGEKFEILGEVSNKYYKIKWTRSNVYVTVSSKYITVSNNVGTPKGIGVNIREKATKSSTCFGDIIVGKININAKEGSYYKVNFEVEGFIKKDSSKTEETESKSETKTESKTDTKETTQTSNILESLINLSKILLEAVSSNSSEIYNAVNTTTVQKNAETVIDSTKTVISEESTDAQKTEAVEKGVTSAINIFSEVTLTSLKLLSSYLENM